MNRFIRSALVALALSGIQIRPHSAAAGSPDPCSLLSAEEVAAVIGASALEALPLSDRQCRYQPTWEISAGRWNFLTIEAAPQGANGKFAAAFVAASNMHAPPGFIDASSRPPVGDGSFFEGGPFPIAFYARRGDAYVEIDMRALTGNHSVMGPILAAKALDRLK